MEEVRILYLRDAASLYGEGIAYATPNSAGMDLRACIEEDLIIPAGEGVRLPTGIAIEMESAEYVAIIAARSSMAAKYGVTFLYRDFRPGFRAGQAEAREKEFYMQKYCGCIFSEEDRYQKQIQKDLQQKEKHL